MHTIDRKAESAALRRNIKAYKAMQAELERCHLGKHVVFHDEKLAGAFDTFHNAATEAHRRCGPDHFLIREVGAVPIQMHPMFYAGLAAGRRPAGAPDPVLTKAVVNATGKLAVTDEDLGAILDVTEHTVEAMQNEDWALHAATRPHEFGVLFVQLFVALDTVAGGDETTMRAWLANENTALGGKPIELIKTVAGLVRTVDYISHQVAQ